MKLPLHFAQLLLLPVVGRRGKEAATREALFFGGIEAATCGGGWESWSTRRRRPVR
jgi:hypothetical protein